MTEENKSALEAPESTVDEVQQPSLEDLQDQIKALTAEAAKYRNQRTKAQQERDDLKKSAGKESTGEDYKKLWDDEVQAKNKLLSKVKTSAIESAVKAKLAKAGVIPDAIDAAAKLVDHSMVEWDDDNGVDEVSAQGAAAKLKRDFPFMFEKKVTATDVKNPAEGKSGDEKQITRTQFDALTPLLKSERIKKGWKVVD